MPSPSLVLMCRRIAAIISSRHVCRRHMCELPRAAAPSLMLPPSISGGGKVVYNFYSPIKEKVVSFSNRGGREEADLMGGDEESYVVGSSRGWLALLNFRTNLMSLCNPLSGRRVDLPPLAGEPFPPGYGESEQPPKVIISSSPAGKDCRALMFLGDGKAAVCRPGRSKVWAPLGEWPTTSVGSRLYLDFVYSAARERFFGLALSNQSDTGLVEELEGWEIDAASLSQRMDRFNRFSSRCFESHRSPNLGLVHHAGIYLVYEEESDRLFLVRRYQLPPRDLKILDFPSVDREKVDFDVYRIDNDGGLELCSSLDGLVMFVGINESIAVRASRYPQLKPNTIYFSDAREKYMDEVDCQTMEAFDYQDKTCSPVYYPSRNLKLLMHLPWFFPTLQD